MKSDSGKWRWWWWLGVVAFAALGMASSVWAASLTVDGGATVSVPPAIAYDYEYIGFTGVGTINHTSSTNTVTYHLFLGYDESGSGTYNLSGSGQISAQYLYVGYKGTGTFKQTNGTNNVYNLSLGVYSIGSIGTYELSSSGQLTASYLEVGNNGTGLFKQTGGTNTVTSLSIASVGGSSGTYRLELGSLSAGLIMVNPGGTFYQSNGTESGNLVNRGTFMYSGGIFNGRLFNYSLPYFYNNFTAGNGMANYMDFIVEPSRTITLNGQGLDNQGTLTLAGGKLSGSGTLQNNGFMSGYGAISGTGGFINNGVFTQTGDLTLSNTGTNINYSRMDLAFGRQFTLATGVTLDNYGNINLNRGTVGGTGSLGNAVGGAISGQGTISSNFTNRGLLTLNYGTTSVSQAFDNFGNIQITGSAAILSGGTINNWGTLEGYGQVLNNLSNFGRVEALYSTLNLKGSVANDISGVMTSMSGKLFLDQGLAENFGQIILAGGAFDNNGHALSNTGQMSGYGSFSTGGLSNQTTVTLTGGPATVNGPVTNEAGGQINITANSTFFTGPVTNYGTVKNTNATITWAGGFTNSGAYSSDPGPNNFTDLSITSSGYLQGGVGDKFSLSGNFQNESDENILWNTVLSDLAFTGGGSHQLYIPGSDQGVSLSGYDQNFAWGKLDLSGQSLSLFDGSGDEGGAQYVGIILGVLFHGLQVDNITGNGMNIYYNPFLADNSYLDGKTYDLMGGGSLRAVVPLPASAWLFLSGLAGLGLLGRRRKDQNR